MDAAAPNVPPGRESTEEPGAAREFDEASRPGRAPAFQRTPGFIGTGAFRRPGRFASIAGSEKSAGQPDPARPHDTGPAGAHRPPGTDAGEWSPVQAHDQPRPDPYDWLRQEQYDRTRTGSYDEDRPGPAPVAPVTAVLATAPPAAAAPAPAAPATAPPGTAPPGTARPDTARPETARPQTARPETARPDTAAPDTAPFGSAPRDTVPPVTAAPMTGGGAAGVSARMSAPPATTLARSGPSAPGAAPAVSARLAANSQPDDNAERAIAPRTLGTERVLTNDAGSAARPLPQTGQLIGGIEHNAAVESTLGADRAPTNEPPFAMYPHETSHLTGSTQPTAAQPTTAQPTAVVKGRVHIEDTVIEKVAALASQDVAGVAGLGGYPARVPDTARDRPAIGDMARVQGARARIEDRQAWVDVVIVIEYGVVVMDVANAVKANVAHALSHMLGLRVAEVNVSITDVQMPRATRQGAHAVGATDAGRP